MPPALLGLSLAAFAALAVALGACGKQGDPHPRPRAVPQPATDLTVRQRGTEVLLELAYPTATVAGLPLERLGAAIVFEAPVPALAEGKVPTLREAELEGMAKPVLELTGPTLDEAIVGGRIFVRRELPPEVFDATKPESTVARVYAVRTKGADGQVSPYSNTAGLKPLPVPPAPGALEVEPRAKGISIRWTAPAGTMPKLPPPPPKPAPATPPATASSAVPAPVAPEATSAPIVPAPEPTAAPVPAAPSTTAAPSVPATVAVSAPGPLPIAGYVVLRREATNPRWGAPLATVGPTELDHLDRTARYGTRYVYTVLTLLQAEPPIESAPQSAQEIDYRDVFAPAPPTELRALLVDDGVRLVWEPSAEADLAGYWIERAEPGAEFRRVNGKLASGSDYTDPAPAESGTLRYRLRAVDGAGNVSAPTDVVAVERP